MINKLKAQKRDQRYSTVKFNRPRLRTKVEHAAICALMREAKARRRVKTVYDQVCSQTVAMCNELASTQAHEGVRMVVTKGDHSKAPCIKLLMHRRDGGSPTTVRMTVPCMMDIFFAFAREGGLGQAIQVQPETGGESAVCFCPALADATDFLFVYGIDCSDCWCSRV